MRKIVAFDTIKDENNFWIWFFAALFPLSWDADTDQMLSEAIMDNYEFDEKWADAFTGYHLQDIMMESLMKVMVI